MTIIVCPLAEVEAAVRLHQPSRAVSLLSPGSDFPAFADPRLRSLRLEFHDIVEVREGLVEPSRESVERLFHFLEGWRPPDPLLIHCWAGVSRSTATAYIAACSRAEAGTEARIAHKLRRLAPYATPNRLLVTLADRLLGRGGAMTRAIDDIGRGQDAACGQLFVLEPPY